MAMISKTPDVTTSVLLNKMIPKKKLMPVLVSSRKTTTVPASPTVARTAFANYNSPLKTPVKLNRAATVVETVIEMPDSQEKILLPGGQTCQAPQLLVQEKKQEVLDEAAFENLKTAL